MKITNHFKIPKAIADSIKQTQEEYDNQGSNLSASSVTTPPRIYWLTKRHADEIEQDVVDLIYSFLGSATHYMAEKSGTKDKGTIVETRYFKEILGWLFSAQVDNYEIKRKILSDFKITSVYSVLGKVKEEWIAQMNTQKYLMEESGHEVEKLQIIAVIRDWSKIQAKTKPDYPKHQVKLIPIELWSREKTEEFLKKRISLLQFYENTPDNELPICSESERWRDPPSFAVMKNKSAKRATKLFDNPIEASLFAKQKGGYVEIREAVDKRCIDYCNCNKFCSYYQEHYGEKNE